MATSKIKKKKIMVQLWGPNSDCIDQQFKTLHIKRDSYLNALLSQEIECLAIEVTFRNCDAARVRFDETKLPERKKLTIELDEVLVVRINEVLDSKNIPRDSFVNRVLFFLLAKREFLENLAIKFESRSELSINPLDGARTLLSDPLAHIRKANDGRFYTLVHFPDCPIIPNGPNLFGLNTAISDEDWLAISYSRFDLLEDTVADTNTALPPETKMQPDFPEDRQSA